MPGLGQTEKSARLNGMSVLPPTADVERRTAPKLTAAPTSHPG